MSSATEAGSRPGRRPSFLARASKEGKRTRPDCPRPCAAHRANLRHAIRSALRQNSLCATRSAQTACRKFDDDALALFGANARSPNRVPQAQPDGWERTACKTCGEIGLKRLPELRWQLSNLFLSYSVYGIAPCAHACDGGLLRRAVAPQSETASLSLGQQGLALCLLSC